MKKLFLLVTFVMVAACLLSSCDNHTHSFGEWEIKKEATCTEEGERARYCSCGEKQIEEIYTTKHNYDGAKCTVCGENNPTYGSRGLEYTISDDGKSYIVSGIGSCTDTDIVIQSIYNGLSVTRIGDEAFYECQSLTSVVIPDSVTSIGDESFVNCGSLRSVFIGDSVTRIGDESFFGCNQLESIYIPDSVTSIGYAFVNCSSLTNISVSEGNQSYKSIDGNLYSKDGKTLIRYAIGKTDTTFIVSNSVTSIGAEAFYGCTSLTSIVIPDGVTNIGSGAFCNCTSLTSIVIPNGVISIDNYAFMRCTSLTSVVIGNSVTSIGEMAFGGCGSLTSIVIPDSVTNIGDDAFRECTSLTSIVIGDSVTSIGKIAFLNCTSLTSIVIPNSVTSIGDMAFRECTSLTDVYYTGSEAEWKQITIGDMNDNLTYIKIHYNYVGKN